MSGGVDGKAVDAKVQARYEQQQQTNDHDREQEVRAAVAESLGRFAAPRELELVSSLPRTALGKLRRASLGL